MVASTFVNGFTWMLNRIYDKAWHLILAIGLSLLAAFGSSSLLADGIPATQTSVDLEIAVWTWKDHLMPDLELRLARALQESPSSAYHHYLYSYLLIRKFIMNPAQMGNLKQAEDLAEQCLELAPDKDYGYFIKAQILDLVGKNDLAKETIKTAESKGLKESWRIAFVKARIQSQKNQDFTEATAPYLEALDKDQAIPDIILPFIIGIAKTHYDEPKEILTALEQIKKHSQHPMLLATLALLRTEMKEYKKAFDIYSKLSQTRGEPEYLLNQSILQYKYLKEPLPAIETLKGLPKSLPDYLQSNRYYHLALAYQFANRQKESEAALLDAMKFTRDRKGVIHAFSEQMIELKKQKPLRITLQAINEKQPGIADVHALIGELLNDSEEAPALALPYYNNAIILEPDNSNFYIGHGLSLYKMKKYREALASFDKAAELSPEDPTAVYNQACMLSLLGNTDLALKHLEKVLHMEPSYVEKIETDPDFLNLKAHNKFQQLISKNKASKGNDLSH